MLRLSAIFLLIFSCIPAFALDVSAPSNAQVAMCQSWVGAASLLVFALAYLCVVFEEKLHLRKSKPVLLAAGLIWFFISLACYNSGAQDQVREALRHNFLEYAELFFFLLVAMTYINAMLERGVFDRLRDWLVYKGFSYRSLFWTTGALAFVISPIADNLTTALIMCAVVIAVGKEEPRFIGIACVNIVVAANAGGAFSPFGDITTLMVWQDGVLDFFTFMKLFFPSLVNFLVPATIMQFFVSKGFPPPKLGDLSEIKNGGLVIVLLFLATIVTAVGFHSVLHLPPVFGMMTGLAYLKLYGYYLRESSHGRHSIDRSDQPTEHRVKDDFDVFDKIAKAEWDTLFFFYGVILAVGGLGFIGYLNMSSAYMYGELGPTYANILVGFLSAIVDNIPVMYAVLSMEPAMGEFQWLLVTLTAGVGGSLLSVGSAAGVALMGQARGAYTFFTHLRWSPVILLGYFASIAVHFMLNGQWSAPL
ncbi:sodium:proton antiporter NhaD [Agaribacterium haliotis]|uniref:sodium:proton antiporter NhaD n=1 Tax=Agaribacterium haliotis TaxID=2013869 RepID=UPI001EFD8BC6|nr:sodium:proton antiporter NhaD [Agaribacterium haliotis]